MPKPAPEAPEYEALPEEESIRPELPLVPVRVVYLGSARNKTVALPGRVLIEEIEEGPDAKTVLKSASDSGVTHYNFVTHDTRGRLIRERLMPATAPPPLGGRRFEMVEHLDHIAHFYEAKGPDNSPEFRVLARKEDMPLIHEHIRRRRSRQRVREVLYSEAGGVVRASD